MNISDQRPSWSQLAKASLAGVGTAWLIFVVVAGIDSLNGPSNDVAMAMFPAASMIALLVALLLFWPLITVMARLGTDMAKTRSWAQHWNAWAAIGAITGMLALAAFMTLISGGAADIGEMLLVGGVTGAFASVVTRWRLRAVLNA